VLPLIVRTRYDRVIAPGQDRLAMFRQALDARDRDTAAALAAAPVNQRRVLDRAQYLRVMGRDADALALLQPFTRDVRATVAAGEEGMWLVNEAAYALVALGRVDEGLRLMSRLSELPIATNGALIATSINRGLMLSETGHYREALDHATRLERDQDHTANGYGKMWIASTIVCALAGLNRTAEAAPYLARMRAQTDDNPNAMIRADLCAGDGDAAAAVLVHWLESDDPEPALLTVQDYSLSKGAGQTGPIYRDLLALRDRPAVRAALDRVGRALVLPVARTGWTDF
jgi:tetratricopeptide (TPR) repeat protein